MKEELKRFVSHDLMNNGHDADIADDENLLLSGLVDSLGMMRLIGHIEDKCGIRVPPEDVTIENFMSINTINRYVEGRLS